MQYFLRHNRFFKNFFFTNIIVFILPLIIATTGYASTYRIVENEINTSSQAMLQNAGSVVDKTIEEIQNITMRLAFDSHIQRFINQEPLTPGSPDIIAVRDAWMKLSDYQIKITNKYIIDLTMSSNVSDIAISTSIPYSKYPFYYDSMFHYGDLSYSEWHELFLDTYHSNDFLQSTTVDIMGHKHHAITYLQSIPVGSIGHPKGILFALIDVDQLNNLLAPIKYSPESTVMIFDGNDQLLLNTNTDTNISMDAVKEAIESNINHKKLTMNKEKYTLTYYESPTSKWTYVSIHPEKVITQKLIVWKRTIIVLISCCLLLGLPLIIYLAWRNSNPIHEIYQTVVDACAKPSEPCQQSYDYLKGSISNLIGDQMRLQDEMNMQQKLLKYSYLKQLLSNSFLNETRRQAYAQNAGVHMDFSAFLCAIVTTTNPSKVQDTSDSEAIDTIIEQVQTSIISMHGDSFFMDLSPEQFVWIYCDNTNDETELSEDFTTTASELIDRLQALHDISLQIDVGMPVNTQTDCFQSYQSAQSVNEYRREYKGQAILWYADIVDKQDSYRFPVETELKLVNQIKEGMTSNVVREVEHIIAENLSHRSLSTERYHQFINTLLFISTRLNENLEKDARITIPSFHRLIRLSKKNVGDQMVRLFTALAEQYENAIHSQQTKLKDQLIGFINDNYDNPNLTLYEIAEEFGMSEGAVYSFFKKHLNTTFSRYLENIRIRNACRMLMDEVNINVIATRVGYISPHSFRRAFKRIKGATPTVYKNIMNDSVLSK